MKTARWFRWRRNRAAPLAAAGLIAIAMSLGAFAAHLLQGPELQVIDAHYSVRGPTRSAADVAVVAIDATTFDQLRKQWPFPRRLHAAVINRLHRDGAKAIAYDVQFTEPTDPRDDQALGNAVLNAGNVVLGTNEVDARGHVGIFGGDQVLRQLHAGWGDTSVKPDGDGIYRRMYYSLQAHLPTFAVAAVEKATHKRVSPGAFPGGSVPINFAGPPGSVPTVSFSSVLTGKVPASFFRGKVVVVGATAATLQDVHQTAASRSQLMAGPEIQANAISTILHGFPLQSAPGWLDVVLIVLLGIAVPLGNLRLRSWRVGALAVGLGVGYAVATQIAFDDGLIVTFTYPLMALLLATFGALGADYLLTSFDHQRTRDTFSRFVPEAVVEDVLARADEDLRLGGEECITTVMFSDLRGFTSFSETLTAHQVISVVNFYLEEMSQAILAAGGTLIAFAGDGIMAVFGAPLTQPDHADRALRAAREMMSTRLDRFNQWLRDRGLHEGQGFRMGIGLNSGLVMAGMVGSAQRVEYTAIGDTTNTASRLEGMTKGSGHMLFLSETTKTLMMKKPDDLVEVGEFEIRGRRARMSVWSVPDPGSEPEATPQAKPPAVETPPEGPGEAQPVGSVARPAGA
jgi:adenylate cyclase